VYSIKKPEEQLPSIYKSDLYNSLLDNIVSDENNTDFYFFPVVDVVTGVDDKG